MRLIRRVRLECTLGASDKFYTGEIFEHDDGTATLRFNWGRRGTAGQTKEESCNTVGYARWMLTKKVDEKLGRGYVQTSDRQDFGAGVVGGQKPPQPRPQPQSTDVSDEPVRKIRLVD